MKMTNDEKFKEDVLDKEFVVVNFCANWCGPCRVIAPFLEEIHDERGIEMVKVNIDENPNIPSQYNIMSIPTLAIFKNGEKVSVNVGAASKARIIDWIESYR
ncbi:MAG: thioredoxin [Holosporaceae bacterium]|jgi:thioredoxin 1|nr:thioredoxin [Holosporaceae bacterium]